MLTVSAAVRLIPKPPALVLSKNTNMSALEENKCDDYRCIRLGRNANFFGVSAALVGFHVTNLGVRIYDSSGRLISACESIRRM